MAEPNSPLIIAGDFNDWSNQAGDQLTRALA
jgi:endonuclease/exonuclease/phosphatase (EEP) superfamily protein YafD